MLDECLDLPRQTAQYLAQRMLDRAIAGTSDRAKSGDLLIYHVILWYSIVQNGIV